VAAKSGSDSSNPTRRFHLDRRAEQLIAQAGDAPDDDLLTTKQMADWFQCSEQWFEIGVSTGEDRPPSFLLSPKMRRYHRGTVKEWLSERMRMFAAGYETVE
jgi:hypothetical protein